MSVPAKFECHITHPTQISNYRNYGGDPDDAIVVEDASQIPIALLFGWAGAADKYLKFYSKIYEDRGLSTVRYCTPPKILMFHSNEMLKIGEEMAKPLENRNLRNRPIIIHIFSNGGAFQYEVFLRALKKGPGVDQVRGVIFDSAPTARNPFLLYKSIKASRDDKLLRSPIAIYLTVDCMVKRSSEMLFANLLKKECIQMNPFENLKNEENKWPQHFIYSKADRIVKYKDVERFANHRKQLGVDVTLECYENSPHVQHYAKNKKSYLNSVLKFVNKCLRK